MNGWLIGAIGAMGQLGVAVPLLAQIELPESGGGAAGGGPGGMSVVIVLLVLLMGIAAGLYWLSKRNGLPMRGRGQGNLQIREMKALGGRQFLVVGEYGKERFLLGVCPGRIDYLCPLAEEPEGETDGAGAQLAKNFGEVRDPDLEAGRE